MFVCTCVCVCGRTACAIFTRLNVHLSGQLILVQFGFAALARCNFYVIKRALVYTIYASSISLGVYNDNVGIILNYFCLSNTHIRTQTHRESITRHIFLTVTKYIRQRYISCASRKYIRSIINIKGTLREGKSKSEREKER